MAYNISPSSGGGTAPTSGPVYTLAADAFGTHPARDYLIINDSGTFKGYSVTGGQSNPVIGSTAITFTTMDQTAYDGLVAAYNISPSSGGSTNPPPAATGPTGGVH